MSSPFILAFGHRKRTGKDTACKMFIEYLGQVRPDLIVEHVSFAKKLKACCYDLFGWAGLQPAEFYELEENAHLREVKLELVGLTPREIWIAVGNKLREVYQDVWVDNALRSPTKAHIRVLSDLRYPNEGGIVEKLGGYSVKMVRPDIPDTDDVADSAMQNYDRWSLVIKNEAGLPELREKVIHLADYILRNKIS